MNARLSQSDPQPGSKQRNGGLDHEFDGAHHRSVWLSSLSHDCTHLHRGAQDAQKHFWAKTRNVFRHKATDRSDGATMILTSALSGLSLEHGAQGDPATRSSLHWEGE
jgi:hypothetical protein